MLQKWLMLTLSSTLLFTMPTTSNVISFHPTMQVAENKVDLKGMIQKDRFGLIISPIQIQFEKDKIENDKKKAEELKLQKEKEIEEINTNDKKSHKQTFILTYYGATYNECGNNKFITASGIPVREGHIAVPKEIPFGSKIIINGNEYIATDRGNPKYICMLNDGSIRVDIFISRRNGESTSQYEKRIAKMGTQKTVGELYTKE